MTNFPGAQGGFAPGAQTSPGVTVATYEDYASAQRAVDYLSDNKFPVEHVSIVGTNVKLVENVLGRMTVGRAALAGLLGGAWFGLLIGLLLGIFAVDNWFGVIVAAVLIGAFWGAVFGAVAQALTRGQRDFRSVSSLQASEYGVTVVAEHVDEAKALLARMTWRAAETG